MYNKAEYNRQWRLRNQERLRQYRREWRAKNQDKLAEYARRKANGEYKADPTGAQRRSRRYFDKIKLAAFDAYGGPECTCCGEDTIDFLVLDHINNDGAVHRREIAKGRKRENGQPAAATGSFIYKWLRDHGYPPGFQVLCANCNLAKSRREGCPHQR